MHHQIYVLETFFQLDSDRKYLDLAGSVLKNGVTPYEKGLWGFLSLAFVHYIIKDLASRPTQDANTLTLDFQPPEL